MLETLEPLFRAFQAAGALGTQTGPKQKHLTWISLLDWASLQGGSQGAYTLIPQPQTVNPILLFAFFSWKPLGESYSMAAALTKSMILEEQSRPQNLEPCALTTLVTLITIL